MATEIVRLCDVHLVNDAKVQAASVDVVIGHVAYQLDLCPEDYDKYVRPLFDLMKEHGRKLGEPPPAVDPNDVSSRTGLPRRGVCPLCDNGKVVSLPSHAQNTHSMSMHEFYVEVGWAQPSKDVCYMCAPHRDLGTPQGLAAHGRKPHGLNSDDFAVANERAKEAATATTTPERPAPAAKKTAAKKTAAKTARARR